MSISALAVRGTKFGVSKVMGTVGVARCCEIKFSSSQREQKISDSSPFDFAPGGSVFFGSSLVGVCKFWDCLRKRLWKKRFLSQGLLLSSDCYGPGVGISTLRFGKFT